MTTGYSGTPLPAKLGVKEGARVAFLGAPPDFDALVRPLPDAVTVLADPEPGLDVAVLFARSRRELEERVEGLKAAVAPAGALSTPPGRALRLVVRVENR